MKEDPLQAVAAWLPGIAGQDGFFPLMSLATVDGEGRPDVRTVLLSRIGRDGLQFHTDTGSRKVEQLRQNPAVAVMLRLPEQARQIVVRGDAVELADLAAAYRSRSRYLQLLAWLNTPEMASLPESERRNRWAEFSAGHPDGSLRSPPQWTGFLVHPERVTLWQGHFDQPSHRTEYTRTPSGWTTAELPG